MTLSSSFLNDMPFFGVTSVISFVYNLCHWFGLIIWHTPVEPTMRQLHDSLLECMLCCAIDDRYAVLWLDSCDLSTQHFIFCVTCYMTCVCVLILFTRLLGVTPSLNGIHLQLIKLNCYSYKYVVHEIDRLQTIQSCGSLAPFPS